MNSGINSLTRIQKQILVGLILISFAIRVFRLDVPHGWSFDEVYHALSAEAYALNDPRGYEWWHTGPKDLAYEWLHPPLGKVFMAISIKLFAKPYIPESKSAPLDGRTTFAWRFPGTIFAALTVGLLVLFGKDLFNNFWIGVVGGVFYALDGLSFVQSRTGMNDIYITFFVVLTFYLLHKFIVQYPQKAFRNIYFVGIASGLAASTKWTGFYAVLIAFVVGAAFVLFKKNIKLLGWSLLTLAVLPFVVYILSYAQWWVQGHTWKQFYELHQQIWWYQTGLKATHDYQSKALSWPLLIRPVWFYVDYKDKFIDGKKELYIGNIYTMGHPFIWWAGVVGVAYASGVLLYFGFKKLAWYSVFSSVKQLPKNLHKPTFDSHELLGVGMLLIAYFGMFAPWAFSPRIMFMYHYLPSVPFLCLLLSYGLFQIKKIDYYGPFIVYGFLFLVVIGFIYFYPHWSDLLVPQKWAEQYYWLKSWK